MIRLTLIAALAAGLAAPTQAVPATTGTPGPLAENETCEASPAALRACYQQPPAHWPPPTLAAGIDHWQELGPLPPVTPPANAAEESRRALGRRLFFDPILSRSGQIACASCHHPDQRFADGRRTSSGHDLKTGHRNSPSLLNTGLHRVWFWDGRAGSLAAQAMEPMLNPVEMAASREGIEHRLNQDEDYRKAFAEAFGESPITLEQVAEALASWQATLRSRSSPFDRFLKGDHRALSDQAILGLHLFRTKARCINCHMGPLLSDDRFHNLGLTYYGGKYEDLGRYQVTRNPDDVGRFRTPSLREVAATAPYMHNGLFPHLRGVLALYNGGGPRPTPKAHQADDPLFPKTSPILQPLGLTQRELDALESFLRSLTSGTGERRAVVTQSAGP
ncbi:hypothetical protein BTO32_09660 [Marinobacter lutaoensis]|uniref:Di-haem cytochrome c peroxidase domain-containing protein n=1 Tax=Marinobacter lutaoensis TaxID=135739 RepID=A0A1V2DR43_9GAMM|nr:cytochrome c peroxidase [Marinobacter lutaoensis]ONF42959.1 hypothetical protein BTO32_09660 [Marinobacter lutaoensis]